MVETYYVDKRGGSFVAAWARAARRAVLVFIGEVPAQTCLRVPISLLGDVRSFINLHIVSHAIIRRGGWLGPRGDYFEVPRQVPYMYVCAATFLGKCSKQQTLGSLNSNGRWRSLLFLFCSCGAAWRRKNPAVL